MTTPEIMIKMLAETIQDKLGINCLHYKSPPCDCCSPECDITERWTGCGGRVARCEIKPEDIKE